MGSIQLFLASGEANFQRKTCFVIIFGLYGNSAYAFKAEQRFRPEIYEVR